MTRGAVTPEKRERMDDSGPTVQILPRVEQVVRNAGHSEIPVCFIEDEGDVSGLGGFYECTQELWRIDGTGLRARSASRSCQGWNTGG